MLNQAEENGAVAKKTADSGSFLFIGKTFRVIEDKETEERRCYSIVESSCT